MREAKITQHLKTLAACLCTTLADCELPATCFCGVMPPMSVTPIDIGEDCEGGMAWVKLVGAVPSSSPPEAASGFSKCAPGVLYEVEVGVARPIKAFSEEGWADGSAPTEKEREDDTNLLLADMDAIKRAITCCYGKQAGALDLILGAFSPLDGLGGVGGGVWTVSLWIP